VLARSTDNHAGGRLDDFHAERHKSAEYWRNLVGSVHIQHQSALLAEYSRLSFSRRFNWPRYEYLRPASAAEFDQRSLEWTRSLRSHSRSRDPHVFFNDNITDDNYGMLVYYAYGELKNDEMRFAAGLQRDIFNPVGPTVLPMSLLYGSGNAGSYRGQIRFERFVHSNDSSQLTFQLGLSNPISTLVRNSVKDPLVEDNGWPNIEGRMALGVGEIEEFMGGRKQRRVEFGISGVVGQIRISKPVPGPGTPGPDRIVDDVWGSGCDLQWAVTDRLGMKGELFIGQTLGEYNAGVLQNFNSETFEPIRTKGAYAEIYCYFHPQLHLHCGYGIDDPINNDLAAGQIASNQTFFNTLLWDLTRTVQFGLEVDYRRTNYVEPLQDANGLLVMTQFLWRF
jgi:hypothetical protein